MEEEAKMHFSYDLEATLTQEERNADKKLKALTRMLANPNYNATIRDFY